MENFSWADPPGQMALPIHRAGYPLIFGAAFITFIFALLGLTSIAIIALVVTLGVCAFFRDPERVIPNAERAVVSPADGKVIWIGHLDRGPFFSHAALKVSIFMSVFNVHVNRIPYSGQIKEIRYHPGQFFAANLDDASEKNERNALFLETESGMPICVVQVAGLIARRIICNVRPGDDVRRGQRFGIICFGSRLDVYLPSNVQLEVTVGDRVKAGTSILGQLM